MEGMKTREEAEGLLKEWADFLELDTDRKLFDDLVEELRGPVRKNRLNFNQDTEEFSYQLIKPVSGHEIVTIKECDFNSKKALQKYKDNEGIDQSIKTISTYTDLSIEEVMQLKDRDINRINAVVLGFLAQVAPGSK